MSKKRKMWKVFSHARARRNGCAIRMLVQGGSYTSLCVWQLIWNNHFVGNLIFTWLAYAKKKKKNARIIVMKTSFMYGYWSTEILKTTIDYSSKYLSVTKKYQGICSLSLNLTTQVHVLEGTLCQCIEYT